MNSRVSWSVDGIDPSVRERAEAAARRAGMSLNDWLNSTIGDSAPPDFGSPYDQRPAMPSEASLASYTPPSSPTVAITTDILVGFCDETDEEHAATLGAQEELRFDGAFTFAYSEREGTTAARKMPDTVSAEVKQAMGRADSRQQALALLFMSVEFQRR